KVEGQPQLSNQKIWPYSDLLLHDIGEGLADNRPEGMADGREWRTPPLWGLGLTRIVNGHTLFLHDGRARSLEEAILWHGGEAHAARDGFAALSQSEREALLAFVASL
ncbi:MAG: di-heme oxidoredictase family protein, partial [Hyphomicrobium sp.]